MMLWHHYVKKSHPGDLIKGRTCVCLTQINVLLECRCSVVKRAGLIGAEKEEEEEGSSATMTWWGLRSRPRIDDSATGRGEREPTRVSQPPPTSNMPYYVDLWRWLGHTFNWVRPGPSKDLSLHKIKGGQGVCHTKANSEGQPGSWTGRFTPWQPEEDISGSATSASL